MYFMYYYFSFRCNIKFVLVDDYEGKASSVALFLFGFPFLST